MFLILIPLAWLAVAAIVAAACRVAGSADLETMAGAAPLSQHGAEWFFGEPRPPAQEEGPRRTPCAVRMHERSRPRVPAPLRLAATRARR